MRLVIQNGVIVDGTGAPRFHGDVAVENGRIASVSRNSNLDGDERIDAAGLTVAPGFIDIHTHSDFPLLMNVKAESYVRQGVTTSVLGACGRSCTPVSDDNRDSLLKDIIGYDPRLPVTWHTFQEYLETFEAKGVAQNIAALVAHNAVRIAVMGYEPRSPSGNELEEMKALVDESMRAGAIGLSTGLAYPPGGNAQTDEIVELAKVASAHGGFYSSHLRGTDGDVLAGAEEALEIGKKAKLPVHMGHFCGFFGNLEETERGLKMIEEARSQGMDVTCDLYPYLAGANPLMAFFPPPIFNKGWAELAEKMRDPSVRPVLAEEIRGSEVGAFWLVRHETLGRIMLFDLYAESNLEFRGKTLTELGAMKRLEPLEAVLSLLADEGKNMFNTGVICQWMGEADNYTVFKKPYHMVGSDGIALAPYGELASFKFHPRAYGTFPRVIARYVRENAVLDLEDAIRKMTSFPAQRIGISNRGRIREGMIADLVVFDYDHILDKSTFERPDLYPIGIEYVLINGEMVVKEGEHTGKLPGKVLRHTPPEHR